MTNDLEEKHQQLAIARQTLEDLKVRHDKIASQQEKRHTTESQQSLLETKNAIQKSEQSIKLLTMELTFAENEDSLQLKNVGKVEEVDQTASLKPNIPPSESGGTGRALGKGKELPRENTTHDAPARNIDFIEKNMPSSVDNDSNEIEKDNSIEPEI